ADLGVIAEGVLGVVCDLVEVGETSAMLAGSVEEHSSIAERVLGLVCAGSAGWRGVRTEGSSALLVEDAEQAAARGAKVLARIAHRASGRGPFDAERAALPPPFSGAGAAFGSS